MMAITVCTLYQSEHSIDPKSFRYEVRSRVVRQKDIVTPYTQPDIVPNLSSDKNNHTRDGQERPEEGGCISVHFDHSKFNLLGG